MTSGKLVYLVRGADNGKQARLDLAEALTDVLEHATAVLVSPVVDGLKVELELASIAPFTRHSLEPFVLEQVLTPAVESLNRHRVSDLGYRLLAVDVVGD